MPSKRISLILDNYRGVVDVVWLTVGNMGVEDENMSAVTEIQSWDDEGLRLECGGKGAENSPQVRSFLPPLQTPRYMRFRVRYVEGRIRLTSSKPITYYSARLFQA
jgi:hypothetical protein